MSILRRFTDFVLQGRIQACATAFVLAYIPLVGSISILIAGLVTLRRGALEGALVFLAATLPYLLSYYSAPSSTATQVGLALVAVVIVTASSFLMWLFALILKRYSSWGFILDLALLLGVAVIGIIHLLYPDVQNWWGEQFTSYFNKTAALMNDMQTRTEAIPAEVQVKMINALKVYATGLIVFSIMFNALMQLLISRWWQAVVFNPGALRKELLRIRLSYVAGILFLIFYPLSSFGVATAIDIMPVVYLVFGIAGLSVSHYFLAKKTKWLGVISLYAGSIGIMILFPGGLGLVALILSVIALFDIGMNFRKRFAA